MSELDNDLVILLIGARQIGKTTVLKQVLQSLPREAVAHFLNLEDPDIRRWLDVHPDKLFDIAGTSSWTRQYIFIDEIQYLQDPSNFLKYIYDQYKWIVKLIVSGSSSFYIDQTFKDSLIGRKRVLEMYTLDFEEFLGFKGEDKLAVTVFHDHKLPQLYRSQIDQLFHEYCIYGGYPEIVMISSLNDKARRLREFALDYVKKDLFDANIAHSDAFMSLFKILADQTGALVNMSELANTLNISVPTIQRYLYIMQKSFHMVLVKPYHTNIRSELTKMPKVYFYDTWLRNAVLNNFDPMMSRRDMWPLLENIVVRELILWYGVELIRFWRTQQQHEVDIILDGRHAFEIKSGRSVPKLSKYKFFRELYPDMSFEFIGYEDVIERIVWWWIISWQSS